MKLRNLIKLRNQKPRDYEGGSTDDNVIIEEEEEEGGSAQVVVAPPPPPPAVFVYKGNKRRNRHHKKAIPNGITHATIHPSVRQIHDFLFQNCQCLVSVSIPKTVKHIHQFAFKGCTALVNVELYDGLVTIERGAFEGCKSLVGSTTTTTTSTTSTTTTTSNTIMDGDSNTTTTTTTTMTLLKLPNTLESIGWFAFSGCTSLVNVHFSQHDHNKKTMTLERGAFLSCESLTKVNLPMGLRAIGVEAFCWCESLKTVSVPSTVELIGCEAFAGCKSLMDVHLQEGLKTVGERAFGWCSSLVNIGLPKTVETIEFFAFGYCTSLANVQLQEGLNSIGQCAFTNCTALFAIALPLSLDELCLKAFSDCTNLRTVEFPKRTSLKIGNNCFYGCKSLVNVSLPPSTNILTTIFAGCALLKGDHASCLLQERFTSLPIHDACYHASTATVSSVLQALDSVDDDVLENLQDAFQMTPFHILATGCHPSVQILNSLLQRYPVDTLELKDSFEMTMMDYLLLNTSSQAVPLIQTVLERAIVDRMCNRLPSCSTTNTSTTSTTESSSNNDKWRSKLQMCLEALHHHDSSVDSRRNHVNTCFFGTVGYCLRLEMTSTIELALWKMRTTTREKKNQSEEANSDRFREDCRFQCGSEVVMEQVIGYLWHGESRSDTALSTFRI
ncbi:unnamed protein product [Cylindrotheca closterium]|uniref:Uncharacterized protein n=1 Tax=Cylindrotheca closterium TaxID=2856 RepID=A0AAD2FLI3_9STRA|nr:unnamed protein product [Cylindrotheca closterium]